MTEGVQRARVTYREVLQVREFQAVLWSQGLSLLGDQVARIAIALLVFDQTGSALAASATYATGYLAWLVGGPFLSTLADARSRRTVMVVCDLARAALVVGLLFDGLPLPLLFTLLVALGLLAPAFDSARGAVLPDLLQGERYVVGNALLNFVLQTGQVLGFLAGGALVVLVGTRGALLLDIGTFLVSAIVLLVWLPHDPPTRRRGRSTLRDAREGLAHVTASPELRVLLHWSLLGAAAVITAEGLAIAVADELGRGAVIAGVLTASVPFGFLLGALALARWCTEAQRLAALRPLGLLCCVPLIATPFTSSPWTMAPLWVLAGVGSSLQFVASTRYIAVTPARIRGRAYGIAVSALMAVQGAALLLAGVLAELTAPTLAVAALSGCLLLASLTLRTPEGPLEPLKQTPIPSDADVDGH